MFTVGLFTQLNCLIYIYSSVLKVDTAEVVGMVMILTMVSCERGKKSRYSGVNCCLVHKAESLL